MSISVADNFQYKGGKPLDARMKFATILDMTAAPVADLYDGCFSYVVAEQKYYSYDSNNENDPHLGKWKEYNSGGAEYSDFTGATSQAAGAHGLVPAPTTGDISKFLKGDGTWATVPMPSFDYSNTSPEANNFSTDEKVIGTWIDGKPLYQKTVEVNNPAIDWTAISYGISNIEKLVSADGTILTTTNHYLTPFYHTASDCFVILCSEVDIRVFFSGTAKKLYATIRYTKTTDTAVASGEKIVGTWIDGKPLYQKTISGLSVATTWNAQMFAYAEVSPLVSDIDNVIDACGLGIEPNSNKKAYMSSIDIQVKNDAWQLQIVNNYVINTITIRYTKTS